MAAPLENVLEASLNTFSSITRHPENFVTIQTDSADKLAKTLKELYDTKKKSDSSSKSSTSLSELIVDGFDEEQVWQQLELENENLVTDLVSKVAKILADKTGCTFQTQENLKLTLKEKTTTEDRNEISKNKRNRKSDKQVKGKQKEKSQVPDPDKDFDNETDGDVGLGDSDEELQKIKSRLGQEEEEESYDPDDKFFDFTGDSDDDLNFDFGPLSKKGQIDESIFEGDEENIDKVSKKSKKKGKKSVTFKDEVDEESKQTHDDMGDQVKSTRKGSSKTVKGLVKSLKKKGSIVDDKFFKLYEMEAFLDQEDKKEERKNRQEKFDKMDDDDDIDEEQESDSEEIDMFGDISSEDEDYHYGDFFDDVDDDDDDSNKAEREPSDQGDDSKEDRDEAENEEEDLTEDQSPLLATKAPKDLFADSDSEGEDADEILGRKQPLKSTFEVRQERLKKKISQMEEASLAEKPWQLMGEVAGVSRPENSLLQENLQFELTARLAPEITEETTQTLEQMIKQRIKDKVAKCDSLTFCGQCRSRSNCTECAVCSVQSDLGSTLSDKGDTFFPKAWNDVERKVKPKENPKEYKKRIVLDQEKSKLSLNEIYEQEYLKQQAKEKAEEEDEPVHKEHEEIKKMMQSLFIKLDALSNFHYTPKQTMPEVKIIADQPSINMEEVAPVSVSEKTVLAPEEVQEKQKGELMADTEKTKTDRSRERRKKKAEKRKKVQAKLNQRKLVEKLNPGLGNKYSKERALEQLEKESKSGKSNLTMIKGDKEKSNLTSSKAFFTQLQDEVKANINSRKEEKRKNQSDSSKNAKKLKL